jgi:hypothetical protein
MGIPQDLTPLIPGPDFVLDRSISGSRIATAGANALTKFEGAGTLVDCSRRN